MYIILLIIWAALSLFCVKGAEEYFEGLSWPKVVVATILICIVAPFELISVLLDDIIALLIFGSEAPGDDE